MSMELDSDIIQTLTQVLIALVVAIGMLLLVRFVVQQKLLRQVMVRVERRPNQFRRMNSDPDPRHPGFGPANFERGPPGYNNFNCPDRRHPLR